MSDENMNIKWECYVLQVELGLYPFNIDICI